MPVGPGITASVVRQRLLRSGIDARQLSRLSEGFLQDRKTSWNRLFTPRTDQPGIEVVYTPTPEAYIGYSSEGERPFMLLTLGLHELLRYHSVVSIWSSSELTRKWANNLKHQELDLVRAYLNLSSVLYLCGKGPLPRIEKEVFPKIVEDGARLAEGSLLFLMLHEVGHAAWDALETCERSTFTRKLERQGFGPMEENHTKELYCDAFVFENVPKDAKGAMFLAAQGLLNIENFCVTYGLKRNTSHPTVPLRYRVMLALAELSDDWAQSAERAIDSADTVAAESPSGGLDVDALLDLRNRLDEGFPWQITFARIAALAKDQKPPPAYLTDALLNDLQK